MNGLIAVIARIFRLTFPLVATMLRFDPTAARRLCLSKIAREESMERVVLYHNPG
jgi:hypothetical protein